MPIQTQEELEKEIQSLKDRLSNLERGNSELSNLVKQKNALDSKSKSYLEQRSEMIAQRKSAIEARKKENQKNK